MTRDDTAPSPQAAARALLARNLGGAPLALTSVCSAHPLAIRGACEAAREAGQIALIEATCNQVNQEGGYTGLTPADYAARVRAAAAEAGLAEGRLLLGGDHLGPHPWRHLPAEEAMTRAEAMVAAYVAAGFGKIHLDCSMRCAGDPEALPEPVIAARAARLAAAAEAALGTAPEESRPIYVIGTEVPPPGGMGAGHEIAPTEAGAVRATVEAHRQAFAAAGLERAFSRVVAVVVQPGLDFGNDSVHHFAPDAADALAAEAPALGGLVYEAHSTDYQRREAYPALVARHFAILKVGPAVTFALREALYALEAIERELAPEAPSNLRAVMEAEMLAAPSDWQGHYSGAEAAWLRHFSWSDRIRYYWARPAAAEAVARLEANLDARPWPLPLVSQSLPDCAEALARGDLPMRVNDVALARIRAALAPYYGASAAHDAGAAPG
ncbi:class II D-tagatose-bisphosphate aldolase non-catalytic subunit [Pseudoroseicyclus sp. CXY001]|uniref:class II D-tagatose-bisphosphate aldolase non-catalytic subunit n=1 Tax=Pseudoroseicyclus sp. CXY001 TaxID=3242492 RepID=UPI00358DB2CB